MPKTEIKITLYHTTKYLCKSSYINNFWKAIANHPPTLQRTWQAVKEVMISPGEIDPLMRELIYIAVSATNGCEYCIASHTAGARAKGMNDTMFGEVMAIAATANMTNRLANGYQIPVDERFKT